MSKQRRDSVTGRMNVIGRFSDWGIKKRNPKAFFRGKSSTSIKAPPDELDDIELLENIVLEMVEFDWEGLEVERNKSLFHKRRHQKKQVRKSQFKEMFFENGAVQSLDITTDEEISDKESAASASLLHRARSEECIHNISSEGKAKLKFIMQFASSGNTRAATKTLHKLSPEDKFRLKNSIHHARLSKLYKNKPKRRSTMLSVKSNTSGNTCSLVNISENQTTHDSFARLKGFRNKQHMDKSMERLRGFEELRDETQIKLMAFENGYKPAKVIDMLNVVEEDNEETANDFSDSEDEEANEVDEFMKLEEDDLEKLMDKWDAELVLDEQSDDEDEYVRPRVKSTEEAIKLQQIRRKKAIRNGWKSRRKEEVNEFSHYRFEPKDSLSARHFEILEEQGV